MEFPFLDTHFAIAWSALDPARIEPDLREGLRRAQANVDAIAAQDPAQATFPSAFLALETASDELDFAWSKISHLESVSSSEKLREAYNAMLPEVSNFYASLPLREDLWRVLKAAADRTDRSRLDPVQLRFLEETLQDFRESGADLPDQKKERLREVANELARLTQKFSENVLDSTNSFELLVDREEVLHGLPESAKSAAWQSAAEAGYQQEKSPRWRFTLHAPSLLPVLKYATSHSLRKVLYEAYTEIGRRAPWDNTELIREILALRAERTALLGKNDFADLVLSRRMAKSGDRALAFIDRLHERIKPVFDRENEELAAFKREQLTTAPPVDPLTIRPLPGTEDTTVEPWEAAFWSEKLRQQRYDFEEEQLRPYFPIQGVKSGLFSICESLFGITIAQQPAFFRHTEGDAPEVLGPPSTEETDPPLECWHPQVQLYAVHDGDGRHLGSFYADWYPRPSKRGGAWMNSLFTGVPDPQTGKRGPNLGLIAGNLTPPVGDRAALLTHDEVTTIFHEFGHLLHHLLGEVSIRSLNGVNVAWDFVELPSQLMENWCWTREGLDRFARHHETGEPIPEDLYRRMIAARNFQSARFAMRQLSFGKLDLELHRRFASASAHASGEKGPGDLDATARKILEGYQPPMTSQPPTMARGFSHLFSSPTGYAAGYYSYKWAEVLDADAFSRFQLEGTLNRKVGMDFREKVLAKGNSEPPEDLFRAFMGRDPDDTALLRRSGLIREKSA